MKALACVLAAMAAIGAQTAAPPVTPVAPVTIEALLQRAGAYVNDFMARYANVVAEEHYVQEAPRSVANDFNSMRLSVVPGRVRRLLKSDFLIVKLPSEDTWMPFRDVFEVDGTPVRDRQERLSKLFLQPAATALEQAKQIASDSSRYNLGNVYRTINVPILALQVLSVTKQPRFRFSRLQEDRRTGPGIWSIDFHEVARPTIIRGTGDADLLSEGRFWIEAATGRVVKSELTVQNVVSATVTTSYRVDPAFGFSVPVEMRERYTFARGAVIDSTATYSKFRRFSVEVEETIQKDLPELLEIPAGHFTMGSPASEAGRNRDETPHEVTISRAVYLGRFEVTQQEWQTVMGTNPSHFTDCGPTCPVENVSLVEVLQFLEKLNARVVSEFIYRLPTEAEWEYACRAGTTTPFSTGANVTTDQANYNGQQPYATFAPGLFRQRPTPVGSFAANPWGLGDMHGNVWEWTADWYGPYFAGPIRDPRGPLSGDKRAIRGGSWFFDATSARCALRYTHAPADRGFSLGFRLAADRRRQ